MAKAKDKSLPNWRDDLPTFAEHLSKKLGEPWHPYNHLRYLSDRIGLDGGGRYIINMPPRHGKSSFISHWLPVWFLEAFPEKWVLLTSYEAELAKHWGRKVRDTFSLPELWTNTRQDVRAANRWYTPEGGGLNTAGADGSITGKGGDLIICDDMYKNWQQAHSPAYRRHLINWFKSTLYTRKEPDATIVVMMTRWHQNDLSGWLEREHSDNWIKISLPAFAEKDDPLEREVGDPLCVERYDLAALQDIKKGVGSRVWAGMYQQTPRAEGGTIINRNWLRFWDVQPEVERIIQSWDMAFKDSDDSSYVVGQAWGQRDNKFFLLDQNRERLSFVATLKALEMFSKRWPDAVGKLIEDKANGPAIISAIKDQVSGVITITPRGSKESRLQAVSPLFEAGNVYLPNPQKYPWVEEYIDELTTFPSAANDDQVDSTSQALNHLNKKQTSIINVKIPNMATSNPWSAVH